MRPEKQQLVQDIRGLIEPSPCVFLSTYKGLKVADFVELRKRLSPAGAECHVVPNRLLRLAATEVGVAGVDGLDLRGDTAMVVGGQDVPAVAKVLRGFGKEKPAFGFKSGILSRRVYPATEMASLASMPPLPVARAQLLGVLQAPMAQLAGVLNAKVASIVQVLQAYVRKQENPT